MVGGFFKYLESARERFLYGRIQESKLYVERESQLIEEGFLAITQGDTILMTVPVIVLADYNADSLENVITLGRSMVPQRPQDDSWLDIVLRLTIYTNDTICIHVLYDGGAYLHALLLNVPVTGLFQHS